MRPQRITSLSFFLTGPIALTYLFLFTEFIPTIQVNQASWEGVLYLSILAIVGTAAAVILFNRLIKETTAVFASSVTYLIPVVALGWGLIDGEAIALTDVLFMFLILVGIFLINMKKPFALIRRFF